MEWISVKPGSSYFSTESGLDWTPIGQNDAIPWPELKGLHQNNDLPSVEHYFAYLKEHGVTCIRIMLEYCQNNSYYLEKPAGKFQSKMLDFWDDFFALAEAHSIRLLITPFDTYWMWRRWKYHPYNHLSGGPCKQRSKWLLCPDMRAAIKNRLSFATQRWGGSGVIFAWDLWNEIQPAHVSNKTEFLKDFVDDVGSFLKKLETQLFGKYHLQTVSVFGHKLLESAPISTILFRSPILDFASTHLYEKSTIDHPRNTLIPALATGTLVKQALRQIEDHRPFLDTEHGPIYTYRRKKILAEDFDDEYFSYMQWAHLASGGCGGGMRWPYRRPHVLTPGMRKAQLSLSHFVKLVEWKNFKRNDFTSINLFPKCFHSFSMCDGRQLIIWLLRNDSVNKRGMMATQVANVAVTLEINGMATGKYKIIFWNTKQGRIEREEFMECLKGDDLTFKIAIGSDMLIYARHMA